MSESTLRKPEGEEVSTSGVAFLESLTEEQRKAKTKREKKTASEPSLRSGSQASPETRLGRRRALRPDLPSEMIVESAAQQEPAASAERRASNGTPVKAKEKEEKKAQAHKPTNTQGRRPAVSPLPSSEGTPLAPSPGRTEAGTKEQESEAGKPCFREMEELRSLVVELLEPIVSDRGWQTVKRLQEMTDVQVQQTAEMARQEKQLKKLSGLISQLRSEVEEGIRVEITARQEEITEKALADWADRLLNLKHLLNGMMLGWSDVAKGMLKEAEEVAATITRERKHMQAVRRSRRWTPIWTALLAGLVSGVIVAAAIWWTLH